MVCFFIGHHDAEPQLMPLIEAAVSQHISEYGVTEFVVGQYGSFDRMAARAVLNARRHNPDISLTILLPYHPTERSVQALEGYDGTFYPPGMEKVPRKLAIVWANRYMLKNCDYLIAYAWQSASNAGRLLEYAKCQKKIMITELPRISSIFEGFDPDA